MARRDIYSRLDAWKAASCTGKVYRHSVPHSPARTLSGEGARVNGGRWNPPDSFPTVYSSEEPATVVAEFLRSVDPSRDVRSLAAERVLWTLNVRLAQLVDLRLPDRLEALGLPRNFHDPVDILRCQEIGDAAYYVGYKGLLVPSVARPEGVNLVIFVDHLSDGDLLEAEPDSEGQSLADHLP